MSHGKTLLHLRKYETVVPTWFAEADFLSLSNGPNLLHWPYLLVTFTFSTAPTRTHSQSLLCKQSSMNSYSTLSMPPLGDLCIVFFVQIRLIILYVP